MTDTLYSIDYPIEGSDEVLTVATVRPETMLADTAVAVHPDDERYRHLVGGYCTLPLVGRRLPIIADEHVDPEFGTGALKITPGHDPNDFEIGRAHGLEEIVVIGEDGRINEAAGERFAGLTTAEAQAAVVAALREQGLLRGEEDFPHSVPFSHRSGERIEPLISLQWFCSMDGLAAPAIDVVERDEVRITPPAAQARLPRLDATTSDPGASRASSGGATGCRSSTRRRARRSSPSPRRSHARLRSSGESIPTRCASPTTSSTPGSAPRCGRSRPSAGRIRTRPVYAPSIRPTRWSRVATSSSSGSRGW